MPRKLIAAQAVVVLGLVALIYFTLLKPDEGGPPRVVDAPGETQAGLPEGMDRVPGPNRPGEGRSGEDRSGPRVPDGAGGATGLGEAGAAGRQDSGSGPAGDPGGQDAPLAPGLPGPGSPDDGSDLGGDGGYGPGDDQYATSITRIEQRIGLNAPDPSP